MLVSTLIGMTLGALTVGVLSDTFGRSLGPGERLRAAILTGLSAGALSAVAYVIDSRRLPADLSTDPPSLDCREVNLAGDEIPSRGHAATSQQGLSADAA